MRSTKTACFFSHTSKDQLRKEQYSIQDIRILHDLGYEVRIATTFSEIPSDCDLYFSWWAAGSILPLIEARVSSKPLIVVAGGNDSMLYRDSLSGIPQGYLASPWYKKLAACLALRFATRVLVVSGYMVQDAKTLGARHPIVVPNSVDITKFHPGSEPRLHVTSIFNLDEHVVTIKRGEVFLRAIPTVLKTYPHQTFVLIGKKGNAYDRLRALSENLRINGNLQFVGSIDNAEVVDWLRRSRIYVQISDTETFGVAIAEAMSCATPVLVSRRGAIPELVNGHGVFVNHNDPESVAEGMISLLSKPDSELRELGDRARQRIAANFAYENRRAAIERVIADISSL